MNRLQSVAFVFFGATGDLAYKKIFPALQEMIKRGTLAVPIIGVTKGGSNLPQLQARARDSLEQHSGVDPVAFPRLISLLKYVDGDYSDPANYRALQAAHVAPPEGPGRDPRPVISSGAAFSSRDSTALGQFAQRSPRAPFHQKIDEGANLKR